MWPFVIISRNFKDLFQICTWKWTYYQLPNEPVTHHLTSCLHPPRSHPFTHTPSLRRHPHHPPPYTTAHKHLPRTHLPAPSARPDSA
jgi:hypothetical protein